MQPYPEPILHLPVPGADQVQPVDVRALLQPALATPLQRNLICQQPTLLCGTRMLQSSLRALHGEVLILNLARLGDNVILLHFLFLLMRICQQ